MSQFQTKTQEYFQDVPNNTQIAPYKPDEIYLPFDVKKLLRLQRRKRMLQRAGQFLNLLLWSVPRFTFWAMVVGGGSTLAWAMLVFVIEPVLGFIGGNWLLICLVAGLIVVIFLLYLMYPEFRARSAARSFPVDIYPSNTQTHVQTTRHPSGITINNIITIQSNQK